MIPEYRPTIEEKLGISKERYYELGDELYLDLKEALRKDLLEEGGKLHTTEMMEIAIKNCENDREACLMTALLYPVSRKIVNDLAEEKANEVMNKIAELSDKLFKPKEDEAEH